MENFEILEEKENLLFNRKELHLKIEINSAPSRNDVREFISKKFSSPVENISINKILGNFGSRNFNIEARIYTSKEDKDQTELKSGRATKDNVAKPVEEVPAESEQTSTETTKEEAQK
ncbi:hypothetical protein KAJ87_00970 [Candidatus Pacearchaeota archaeon]|nr:hypothetical protein [Candidatus Pacearchaeota archaeon]